MSQQDFELSDGKDITRFQEFKVRIFAFYTWRWNQECPWDGGESNQLSRLLKCCPKLEVTEFSRWLFNYGRSDDISPGERPRKFLPRIHDYSITRLDRFRRDPHARTGETFAERDSTNTAEAARRILENLGRNGSHVVPDRKAVLRGENETTPRRPERLFLEGD